MFPRRGRRWFFDEFFDDFDKIFEEMEANISRIFEEAKENSLRKPGESNQYVYGFSMRIGPDGRPHIEKFGNIPRPGISKEERLFEGREPLTDIIEGEDEISVIAELPGIEKKDINLNATEDTLEIRVDTPERKYYKILDLPYEVKPETAKASYKNGVLEVKIRRRKEEKESGVRVNID